MLIFEFMAKYCQDIIRDTKKQMEMIDLTEFPYDAIVVDSEGREHPAIEINGIMAPINDIFVMTREDFCDSYKVPNAGEAYDNYMENMSVLEGPEAVSRIRIILQKEAERIKKAADTYQPDWLD